MLYFRSKYATKYEKKRESGREGEGERASTMREKNGGRGKRNGGRGKRNLVTERENYETKRTRKIVRKGENKYNN